MGLRENCLLLLILITSSCEDTSPITEQRFVTIGGIEQWITIEGDNKSNPVILFIHGGPGSTMSQFGNQMYAGWEKDFTLVNWDQRGAGKTFGKNAPHQVNEDYWIKNPLTVSQMSQDGIELTKYLLEYLDKEKVILVGTSWGSILSVEMALGAPELYYAYVGHAQFVNFEENINHAYQTTLSMASIEHDATTIQLLESLGAPPYPSAKTYGQLLRMVKSYERKNAAPAPDHWFKIVADYDNEQDGQDRFDGDDYSFIHFVGHSHLGIPSMVSRLDFNSNAINFSVPVYLIQGEQDILTAQAINKPYFDKIHAPDKAYHLISDAAHGHNQSVVDKQLELVRMIAYTR